MFTSTVSVAAPGFSCTFTCSVCATLTVRFVCVVFAKPCAVTVMV